MRIFYILILILCWSILILGPINARADDKWSFEKLDGFNYCALAGEVTHGDKLRFKIQKKLKNYGKKSNNLNKTLEHILYRNK